MEKNGFSFPFQCQAPCVWNSGGTGNAPDSLIAWSLLPVGYNSALFPGFMGLGFYLYSTKSDGWALGLIHPHHRSIPKWFIDGCWWWVKIWSWWCTSCIPVLYWDQSWSYQEQWEEQFSVALLKLAGEMRRAHGLGMRKVPLQSQEKFLEGFWTEKTSLELSQHHHGPCNCWEHCSHPTCGSAPKGFLHLPHLSPENCKYRNKKTFFTFSAG